MGSLNPFKKPKVPQMKIPDSVLSPPPAPAPLPEPVSPVLAADDETLAKARKKQMQQQQLRSGRASTVLSDDSDSLGS